jgi:hypothetical protein
MKKQIPLKPKEDQKQVIGKWEEYSLIRLILENPGGIKEFKKSQPNFTTEVDSLPPEGGSSSLRLEAD